MAKPRKGVVPPQLRKYLFKKRHSHSRAKRGGNSMAKRKKGSKKSKSRAQFLGIGASVAEPLMAFGWGYGRTMLLQNDMVASAVAKVPGGAYADNILFGGGAAAITLLFRPTGIAHTALKIVALSEAFNAGQKLGYGIPMTASSNTSSSGVPVIM